MTDLRRRLGAALARVAIALTVGAWVLGALGVAFIGSRFNAALDGVVFFAVWGYVLLLPLAGGAALVLGDRKTRLVRSSLALLVLWLLTVVWLATAHLA